MPVLNTRLSGTSACFALGNQWSFFPMSICIWPNVYFYCLRCVVGEGTEQFLGITLDTRDRHFRHESELPVCRLEHKSPG